MTHRTLTLIALLLSAAPAMAQEAPLQPAEESTPTLQQRLVPQNAAALLAPAVIDASAPSEALAPASMAPSGSGTGLMIAGAALFVAGLIVGDDAGTLLAVTGAAIGAYGLYLYFR